MLRFLYACIFSVMLSGCSLLQSKPEVQIQIVKEYIHVEVPSEYYAILDVPKPPTKEQYSSLSCSRKEYTLIMYSNELLATLAQYHKLQMNLRKWNDDQNAVYRQNKESVKK